MNLDQLKQLQQQIAAKSEKFKKTFWRIIFWAIIFPAITLAAVALIVGIVYSIFHPQDAGFVFVWGIAAALALAFRIGIFAAIVGFITFFIAKHFYLVKDVTAYESAYKQVFVRTALEKVFTNLFFDPSGGISRDTIRNTGMMNAGDRFRSNDYISGHYKNIALEQSDVHIEEEHTDSDGDSHYQTIFLGRWMIFDFNKNFKTNLQVASKKFTGAHADRKRFHKVQMEDTEFNKLFVVNTEDDHNAYYILTPHFMDRIKTISAALDCGIMFCFVDNRLHVAVNDYKDSFEPNPYKEINEAEIEASIGKDIKLITDFVEELNLTNNLFKQGA